MLTSTCKHFVIFCFGLTVCFATTGLLAADRVEPWNVPHFSVEPKALYSAASANAPAEGTDVVVLNDEESYVFDASGRSVHTEYMIYKVLTQRGAEGWDAVSTGWEPWHEKRPTVKARVITADGTVHELDAKTITDAPAKESSSSIYSDRRVMRAPLPAIAPGSVVEEELVSEESAPFFGAGNVGRFYFGRMYTPVEHSRLTLDWPSSLPLKYALTLLPDLKPQRSEADGKIKVVFDQGPTPAIEDIDNNLPCDVPAIASVAFSTGASWQQIAEDYAKIVEAHVSTADVKAMVEKLTQGKPSRSEKAQAILAYLNKNVRYTGVEFGEAALVPHAPAETLAHKYGDCKDKATLLVAMLRAAGIPAYVALLNAGDRLDVPADLPGMGLFDHAIVYAPGDPAFWIDATDEYARLGQLPTGDQGRLALVVRPESNALVRTSEMPSKDNALVEEREIYLADIGPARIVEISHPQGPIESEYRSYYADKQNKDNREGLNNYVKSQYLAEKLDRMDRSDPSDFSRPFELILESQKAKRGFTDLENAVAAIRLESLFSRLPSDMQQREEKDEHAEKPKKKRTADYELPQPFLTEWHYKIASPTGFQPKPLPQDVKLNLGPALLTEQFSRDKDETVRAVIRFDTVKRRLTAQEAAEMRDKIAEMRESAPIMIGFEPRGRVLLREGKVRESFQSHRRMIAEHPKDAVHHLRIAKALLEAGMGEAARNEARLAVKLEPNSALAQKSLAEILEYDLVGRKLRPGSDYAGAAAALRAAIKLDPTDKEIAGNLAILLEYNEEGLRYGRGAKLKEAIAEYRKLSPEDLAGIGLKGNLAYALFYAGEFAEARKSAESLNPVPKALIAACEAAINGTQAALAEATKRAEGETQFKEIVRTAGEMLMNTGKYSLAADLLQSGADGDNAAHTMGLAAMLRKAKPREEIHFGNTPEDLLMRFFELSMDSKLTLESLNTVLSKNALVVMKNTDPEETEKTLSTGKRVRRTLARTAISPDVTLDILIQAVKPSGEGDDTHGYRERLQVPGGKALTCFIVKESGQYKILDCSEKPNSIGLEILDRLAANDPKGARILLDWLREEQHLAGGDDPMAGEAFPRFWTKGKEADAEHMKWAAAAILVQTKPTAKQGVEVLEAAQKLASNETDKVNISLALLDGYGNIENYEKLLAVSSELAKQFPESKRVFFSQAAALRALARSSEADDLAQQRMKRISGDPDALRTLAMNAVFRENYQAAYTWYQKLADAGNAEASDLNGMAWQTLFFARTQGADIESAIKASQLSQNSPAILHTLACVYAEAGKTKEAREVLIQAMDLLSLDEPDPDYWYALGRIAEQYGERDIALSDYSKVSKPKQTLQIPDSSYRLAQNRTKVLQAAVEPSAPLVTKR